MRETGSEKNEKKKIEIKNKKTRKGMNKYEKKEKQRLGK